MSDDVILTGRVDFSTGNADQAMAQVAGGAARMAQAVQQAGQQVAQGAQAVGQGAQVVGQAAQTLTRDQSRLVESIRRTTIQTTEGRTAWLEQRAAIAGVSNEVAPYIQRMRDAEQGQNRLGVSAAQTAAAMRGVPAQMTDIITSLQGGQAPITVLLQQGGQLKDMFGGIGSAARALGGYIAGMVNPLTVGAAAVAVLAFAASQGAKELREFQNAATLTGNAIGLSASSFAQLRDSIAGIAGTKGKAAEALTAIAESGLRAGSSTKAIAEAAILMEKATGQAISKTVEQFKDLQKSPADAAAKLNEQTNFLTSAIYGQIKALEDQGRAADAAKLAEQTYADALKLRAAEVLERAGTMEKAWRGVANFAKGAWDAMLGIGRDLSPVEEMSAAAANVARIQAQLAGVGTFATTGGGAAVGGASAARKAALEKELEAANKALHAASDRAAVEYQTTRQKEEQNRLQAMGIQFQKDGEQFETKQQRREKELTKARIEGQELVKAGLITERELIERLNGIRQKYNDTTGQSEVASIQAKTETLKKFNEELRKQIGAGLFDESAKPTEAETRAIQMHKELAGSITGVARAQKLKALAAVEALAVQEKENAALEIQKKKVQEAIATTTKQEDAIGQQADAIRQQAAAQEAANASFGKSKVAVEAAALAQLKLNAAEDGHTDKFYANLQQKVEAQERYVKALREGEFLQENQKLDEASRVLKEDAITLQLEVSLLGRSREEREKIIAQRKAEVALAKELAGIDKLDLGPGDQGDRRRQQLRDKAQENARLKGEQDAQKVTLDEWQRTTDSINQSLTDALLRGFESGKGFAQNFRDTLKNMFSTMVLKPIVQAVLQPVSSQLAAFGQQVAGQATGTPPAPGGAILPPIPGLSGATAFGLPVGFLASVAAGGAMVGNAIAQALGLKGAQLTTASIGGALLGGIPGAILGSLVKPGGGPKTESGFGINVPLRGDPAAAKAIVEATQAQYKAIAGQLAQDLKLGVFTATDPKGNAQTQVAFEAQLNGQKLSSRGDRLGGIENVGRTDAELQAALTDEANRVVLKALEETHLPDKIGAYLKQLGDVDKLSGGALTDAVAKLQKAMTERATLDEKLFDLTHTDLEKSAAARQKERAAIDETNLALYDHVAALTDLTAAQNSARDSLLSAFQTQSDALKGVIERNQGFAKSLRDLRDSLSDQLPGSRSARATRARSVFEGTLSSAVAGNEPALQGLGGAGTAFIEAAKAVARTPADVAIAIAKVQAGLTTAAASSDGRATAAQQQLDAMTAQLSALGLLNSSVLSVGEALGAYLKAQTAIEQENLRYTAQLSAEQASPDAAVTVAATAAAAAAVQSVSAPAADAETVWRAFLDSLNSSTTQNGAAAGGYRTAGLVPVGELGPEIVDFQTPGRVYTNEQTRGMFASNAALVPLLTKISAQLAAQDENRRREAVAMLQQQITTATKLKKFDNDGIAARV